MKNIKNLWSIICRSSSIDRDTNVLSLLDVVEEITITSDLNSGGIKDSDIIPIPFEFVTMWHRSEIVEKELSINTKITVVGPNGKENVMGPIMLKFENGKPNMRLRVKVNGISFNGFGSYKFKVSMEEKGKFIEVQEIPLEIKPSIKV